MGLTMIAVANLYFTQITPNTPYSSYWTVLVLSGMGYGLTISPLAAVVMSSVSSAQGGVASAILNTTTRIGGVLGISLQGTILSQRLADQLRRSLSAFNLSPQLQDQLISKALHQGAEITTPLPSQLDLATWQQTFDHAFVYGLRANVLLASVLLLVAIGLILVFLPSNFKKHS
jgi:DHA2 family methylenomycin A resistance protein-like MFS transporter